MWMKRKSLVGLFLGSLMFATAAFAQAEISYTTDLYQFFPKKTGFYLELVPTQSIVNRLEKTILAINGTSKTQTQVDENTAKIQKFFEVYNNEFEKKVALGAWSDIEKVLISPRKPAKTVAAKRKTPVKPTYSTKVTTHYIAVTELQSPAFAEQLLTIFKLKKPNVKIIQNQFGTFIDDKTKDGLDIAITDKYLLIGDSVAVLQKAFSEQSNIKNSISERSEYNDVLKLLPSQRQGTILYATDFLNDLSQRAWLSVPMTKLKGMQNYTGILKSYSQIYKAFPVVAGSIQIDDSMQIVTHFKTPAYFEKTPNQALASDLKNILIQQISRDELTRLLPPETLLLGQVQGIAPYYDLAKTYFLSPGSKQWLASNVENKSGELGLDFRTNILGFFDQHIGFAFMLKDKPKGLLFLNKTERTEQTIEKGLGFLAFLPETSFKVEDLSSEIKLRTINSKKQSLLNLGILSLPNNYTVIGSQDTVQQTASRYSENELEQLSDTALFKVLSHDYPDNISSFFFLNGKDLLQNIDKLTTLSSQLKDKTPETTEKTDSDSVEPTESEQTTAELPKEKSKPFPTEKVKSILSGFEGISAVGYYTQEGDATLYESEIRLKLTPVIKE